MSVRYQQGYLRCTKRKNGSACWEFMWREQKPSGKRVHRSTVIGTTDQYPSEELAREAVRGLRMQINEVRNRQPEQAIHVGNLIGHYLDTELAATWHSHATRIVYRKFLTRWIKPYWDSFKIRDIRTVAVESWLRQLRRQDGDDLANSTKAKIRSVMSVLFNHAIRYEWLEQGRNPITFVRQSAMRKSTPSVLEPQEIQALLSELEQSFRLMVLLDVTTGLRRSELFALKWSDIDFWNLAIDVRRSICEGVVGNCKTEASRKSIPLSLDVAADLWLLKEDTSYAGPENGCLPVLASKGKVPGGRT